MPLYREDLPHLQRDLDFFGAKGDNASVVQTENMLAEHGLKPEVFSRLVDPRIAEISPQRTRMGHAS